MQCWTCGEHGTEGLSLLEPENAPLLQFIIKHLQKELAGGSFFVCHACVVEIQHWRNFRTRFQTSQTHFQQVLATSDSRQQSTDLSLETKLAKCQVLVTKLLQCDSCSFYTNNKTQLESHMRSHVVSKTSVASVRSINYPVKKKQILFNHKCHQCKLKYYCSEVLAWHIENCHGPSATVKVIKIGERKGNYHCTLCKTVFKYQRQIICHLMRQHGIKNELPFKCQYCDKQFINGICLSKHQRSCVKNMNCPHCHVFMYHQEMLDWHIKYCHGPDAIVNILMPGNNRRNYQCVFCNFKLDCLTKMIFHLSGKHKLKNFPYHCNQCGKQYVITHTLYKHQLNCKGKAEKSKNVSPEEKIGTKKCHMCNDVFENEPLLKKHISKIHANIPCVKCKHCTRSFPSNKQLFKHCYKNHRGKIILKCEFCDLEFASYNGYFFHTKYKHNSSIDLTCKICSKKFTYPEALKKHVDRIHNTVEKAFLCHICSASFKCHQYLKKHIEAIHTGTILRCFHCKFNTRTKANLVTHLRVMHS